MKITEIDPADLPTVNARENSASAQLFKQFNESAATLIQVELDETDKSVASVRSTMGNYVQRHKLNIRVFTRGGNLYLQKVAPKDEAAEDAA